MRNMKDALRFATLVTFLVCACFDSGPRTSAQQSSTTSIVGRWRSLATSKGGIGEAYEFHSDGTVDSSIGAIVEMPWRIENDQLILPPATTDGAEQKETLKWLGDDKVSLASTGAAVELTRVGSRANAEKPILGEWIENREIGGSKFEAHYLFYADSKLLLVMPFVTQHGSYTISGSALHFELARENSEVRFEVADNLLTVSELDGSHSRRYARY